MATTFNDGDRGTEIRRKLNDFGAEMDGNVTAAANSAQAAADSADDAASSAAEAEGYKTTLETAFGGVSYLPPVEYASGIDIDSAVKTVEFEGEVYAALPSTVPFTTSGTFETANFRIINSNANVMALDSIADLVALPAGLRREDMRYLVKGYHAGSGVGGGEFYYDPARIAENDGGTILDGFVRLIRDGAIYASYWGAGGDPNADDTTACVNMISAVDSGTTIVLDVMLYPDGETNWPEIVAKNNVAIIAVNGGGLRVNKAHNSTAWRSLVFTDCDNVIIRDVIGYGGREENQAVSGEGGMGVRFLSCRNVWLENSYFLDYWGDGFYFGCANNSSSDGYGNDDQRDPNENITMIGCKVINNRRQGMSIIAMENGKFFGCEFSETNGTAPEAGVDLEPNDPREKIVNLSFYGCDFKNNSGGGFITAGQLDLCENIFVDRCVFKDNDFGLSSRIKETHVSNCYFDGAESVANAVGGATVRYGTIKHCKVTRVVRTAFGFNGSDGFLTIQSCEHEYAGGQYDDTSVYIDATGGSLIIKDCPSLHSRLHSIRAAESTALDYFEVSGNGLFRHTDAAGPRYVLNIGSMVVSDKAIIKQNKAHVVPGSIDNSIVFALNGDTDYLVEGNDVSGWNRTDTNWYNHPAGSGSIDFGYGNTMPSGQFAKPSAWDDKNGYIRLFPYSTLDRDWETSLPSTR